MRLPTERNYTMKKIKAVAEYTILAYTAVICVVGFAQLANDWRIYLKDRKLRK